MKRKPNSHTFGLINLRCLVPDPFRLRRHFDPVEDTPLVESVKKFGILTPLIVSPNGHGMYTIVDGHLRYEASGRNHLKKVPCMITPPLTTREICCLRWDLHTPLKPFTVERRAQLLRIRELTDTTPAS